MMKEFIEVGGYFTKMKKIIEIFKNTFFLIIVLLMLIPFSYMLFFSLRISYSTAFSSFSFSQLTLKNYLTIFNNYNFSRYFTNSVIVAIGSCMLNVIVGAMAGYGFAKKHFWGRDKIFFILLITLIIPSQVTMIPLYIIMKNIKWINTYQGVTIPLVTFFSVFLMRQFMMGIPNELIDAARIDGCSEMRIFINIILPLAKPAIISLTIFSFITAWNSFLWPLIITTSDEMRTLTLGLSTLQGNYSTNYGLVMAGCTLTFIPPFILYMVLQKKFVKGVTLSGIKG